MRRDTIMSKLLWDVILFTTVAALSASVVTVYYIFSQWRTEQKMSVGGEFYLPAYVDPDGVTEMRDGKPVFESGQRINFENDEKFYNCTATVIDDNHFLTAAHCGEPGKVVSMHIYEETEDGYGIRSKGRYPVGEIVESLPGSDIAVARIYEDSVVIDAPSHISSVPVDTGDLVSTNGATTGISYGRVTTLQDSQRIFVSEAYIRKGDSGGPVWNKQGDIVGVVSGIQKSGHSYMTSVIPHKEHIEELVTMPSIPAPEQIAEKHVKTLRGSGDDVEHDGSIVTVTVTVSPPG